MSIYMCDDDKAFRAQTPAITRIPKIDATIGGRTRECIRGASQILGAAKHLNSTYMSESTAEYILTFHALELGLKAFLMKQGTDPKTLARRPYSHNLVALYDKALDHGLSLDYKDADKMLRWINKWHNNPTKIRYEFGEQRTLPMCVVIFPLVEAIIRECAAI